MTRVEWTILVVRLPAEPSRHRVAVWRELRRAGAVQVAPGGWAMPALPVFAEPAARVRRLVARGGGEVLHLSARGSDEPSAAALEATYTAAREAEWSELIADCGKYRAELDREIAAQKYTLAELDEEEQSMERLRRWHRELSVRDVFNAPSAAHAATALEECAAHLEDYTGRVFRALDSVTPQ